MKNNYLDSDAFRELLHNYEEAMQSGSPLYLEPEDYVDIADYYMLHDQVDATLDCVEFALERYPDEEDLLAIKSSAYIFFHRLDEAEDILNALPSDELGHTYFQRAQLIYAKYGDVERAEEMFQEWIDYDIQNGQFADDRERAEAERENYIHVISSLVELAPERLYDPEVVKRWIEEYYVKFQPLGDFDSDLILCDIVREEGMTDMVEKIYSAVLETNPYINMGWTVLAGAQNANGHMDQAIESCEFALAINPDDYDAMLSKAYSYYYTNRRVEALPWVERFIEGTGDISQFLPLGMCLMAAERLPEAIAAFDKALDYYTSISSTQSDIYLQALCELSEAYYGCEANQQALECIDKALAIEPNDPSSLLMRGSILMSLDNMGDCSDCFYKCIANADDKIWFTLAVAARYTLGAQYDTALELLDTCTSYPDQFGTLRHLSAYRAFAYFKKEDALNYLTQLKLACEQCPDSLEMLMYDYFPPTVQPKDYFDYTITNIRGNLK